MLCRVPLKEDDDETRRAPTRFAVPLLPSSSPRACKPPRGSSEIKPAGRDRKGSHQHCSSASECEGVKRKVELTKQSKCNPSRCGLIWRQGFTSYKLQISCSVAPNRYSRAGHLISDKDWVSPGGLEWQLAVEQDKIRGVFAPCRYPVVDFPPHFALLSVNETNPL